MRNFQLISVCVGTALTIVTSAPGQNLFVSDYGSGNIYEFTPGGAESTFARDCTLGHWHSAVLAICLWQVAVTLIAATIYMNLLPMDVEALLPPTGVSFDGALAFNSAGNLFEADPDFGYIYEFTPGGAESNFASGLQGAAGLAFNSAGYLFLSDFGNIYEFTPGGMRSTFASGLGNLQELAFNSASDLFAADYVNGNIYEFTPSGVQSTFASGLNRPIGLAFNNAGDLFETDYGSGNVYEFAPDGTRSTFASGLSYPLGLAFQPTPEPSLSVADFAWRWGLVLPSPPEVV